MSGMIEVARYAMLRQAELAVSLLQAHGVAADIPDRHLVNSNSLLTGALGDIRVVAPDDQVALARALLARASTGEFGADDDDDGEWAADATPGQVGELYDHEITGALSSGGLKSVGRVLAILLVLMLFLPVAGCFVFGVSRAIS